MPSQLVVGRSQRWSIFRRIGAELDIDEYDWSESETAAAVS
ncbi:hypothetical protein ACFWPX_14225 [Nocardia sp. NPDC058518]